MFQETNDLISIEELCSALSIGRNTAYRLLISKQLKAFKIGRVWKIPRIALEEYIHQQSGIAVHDF